MDVNKVVREWALRIFEEMREEFGETKADEVLGGLVLALQELRLRERLN